MKQFTLALVLSGIAGVGCSQSQPVEPEPSPALQKAPSAPAPVVPAAVTEPTQPSAATTPPVEAVPADAAVAEVTPGTASKGGIVSKVSSKASAPSKVPRLGKKAAVSSF